MNVDQIRLAVSAFSRSGNSPRTALSARECVASWIEAGGGNFQNGTTIPVRRAQNVRWMPAYWGTDDFLNAVRLLCAGETPMLPRIEDAGRGGTPFVALSGDGLTLPDGSVARAFFLIEGVDKKTLQRTGYDIAIVLEDDGERGGSTRLGYYTSDPAGSGDDCATYNLLRVALWVIENPDLAEKRSIDTRTKAEKRQRNKSRPDKPRLVTVVDLRASHKKAAADVEAAERTYRHRWIVRGHWHRYRVGKGRTEERLNYVMPYVKGPAGAPLNATERVFQW